MLANFQHLKFIAHEDTGSDRRIERRSNGPTHERTTVYAYSALCTEA